MNDSQGEQITQLLRAEYDVLEAAGAVEIRTDVLASKVMQKLDPRSVSPALISYVAILELRQLARGICRRKTNSDVDASGAGQRQLWDGKLQPRYPVTRGDVESYVRRDRMTKEERRTNSAWLRATGTSLIAHADALDAETDALVERGEFDESA